MLENAMSQLTEGNESLCHTLDGLLARYLELLHQYQSFQQSMANDFSNVRIDEPLNSEAFGNSVSRDFSLLLRQISVAPTGLVTVKIFTTTVCRPWLDCEHCRILSILPRNSGLTKSRMQSRIKLSAHHIILWVGPLGSIE